MIINMVHDVLAKWLPSLLIVFAVSESHIMLVSEVSAAAAAVEINGKQFSYIGFLFDVSLPQVLSLERQKVTYLHHSRTLFRSCAAALCVFFLKTVNIIYISKMK